MRHPHWGPPRSPVGAPTKLGRGLLMASHDQNGVTDEHAAVPANFVPVALLAADATAAADRDPRAALAAANREKREDGRKAMRSFAAHRHGAGKLCCAEDRCSDGNGEQYMSLFVILMRCKRSKIQRVEEVSHKTAATEAVGAQPNACKCSERPLGIAPLRWALQILTGENKLPCLPGYHEGADNLKVSRSAQRQVCLCLRDEVIFPISPWYHKALNYKEEEKQLSLHSTSPALVMPMPWEAVSSAVKMPVVLSALHASDALSKRLSYEIRCMADEGKYVIVWQCCSHLQQYLILQATVLSYNEYITREKDVVGSREGEGGSAEIGREDEGLTPLDIKPPCTDAPEKGDAKERHA
ncbi:hypothetical protein cyc_06298 [Cyclospora cayetanensis]|uniref:Uncharacterized protein n=1 Tax=Cyclospora cayetanensis TaxID=88456 RepID=A0A1D3D0X7_9EIME|nr:hypothetical protein cyc_06298 [Cyclospora cayetanensis]